MLNLPRHLVGVPPGRIYIRNFQYDVRVPTTSGSPVRAYKIGLCKAALKSAGGVACAGSACRFLPFSGVPENRKQTPSRYDQLSPLASKERCTSRITPERLCCPALQSSRYRSCSRHSTVLRFFYFLVVVVFPVECRAPPFGDGVCAGRKLP